MVRSSTWRGRARLGAVVLVAGAAAVLAACATPPGPGGPGVTAHTITNSVDPAGRGTLTVDGCQLLGPDSVFTQRVDGLPAVTYAPGTDPIERARTLLESTTAGDRNSMVSGSSRVVYNGSATGFPLNTVAGTTRQVNVGTFDTGIQALQVLLPPVDADVHWQFEPNQTWSDRHLLVLDRTDCRLQEHIAYTHALKATAEGVEWDLPVTSSSTGLRRDADGRPVTAYVEAAGLPIAPLVYRFAEVYPSGATGEVGTIAHALRIDLPKDVNSGSAHVWPAVRTDGVGTSPDSMPMGARLRLRQSALDRVAATAPAGTRAILTALHRYGAVVSDSTVPTTDPTAPGSFALGGEYDPAWPAGVLEALAQVRIEDFEVVDTSCWQGTQWLTVRPAPLPTAC